MRYIIILSICSLVISSCKKQDTIWDADWSAPLVNDTLTLANLVNDSTLSESGGIYHLSLKRTLFDLNVSDLITIPDTTVKKSYTISFQQVNVPPGTEFAGDNQEFDFSLNNLELKQIILKQGWIDVKLGNVVETKAIYIISLPGVKKDGAPFYEQYEVPAGTIANPSFITKTIDLSGYEFDLTGTDGTLRNTLESDIRVKSDPSGPAVVVTNNHVTEIDVTFRDVKVSYARGYFGDQILSDTNKVKLEVMDIVQGGVVDLPASTVKFEIENGIKVGANALISKVSGTNASGTAVDLANAQIGSSFNIDPAVGAWNTLTPSTKQLEFNSGNSNIESFLENMSSNFDIGYKMQLNPWGNVSGGTDEIFPHSRIRVNLYADMPMTVGLDNLLLRDTFAFDLEQDVSSTHVTKGRFFLKASNAFPFSAAVSLKLLDANKNVLHTVVGSNEIQSGAFGTLNASNNLMVSDSEVTFDLPESVVKDISLVKFILVESLFNSINPGSGVSEPMDIPVGAYLSVKLRTRFTTENHF